MRSDSTTRYVADILSQPAALRSLLAQGADYETAAALVRTHESIVLTGMGASFSALWPAWRRLVNAGWQASHIETAELLTLTGLLRKPGTVVIAASQSGRSAELLALAERIRPDQTLIAITNTPDSPLAAGATAVIGIHAGQENAVSTKTYLNTLLAADLLVGAITGLKSTDAHEHCADALDAYLERWRAHVDGLRERVGLPPRAVIVGREDSFAAATYGALILKEAAKWPVEASTAAQFRHGPLELADERLSAFVLAGAEPLARGRNLRLAQDIQRFGAHAFWIDTEAAPGLPHIEMPAASGATCAIAEAVPLQLLSVALAESSGIEPGKFRQLSKVTTVE